MNKETWKEIPEYEGLYEVSDLGRVRSMDREVIGKSGSVRKHKGRILKQTINKRDGRLQLNLSKDGKQYKKHPYVLVAQAFIGERPKGYDVCHIDGDLTNNKLTNIRFDTRSQNRIDNYRYGGKTGRGKLTIEQVLEIRRLHATGNYKQIELAKKFNVGGDNISRIVTRRQFTWLNDDGTIDDSQTAVS